MESWMDGQTIQTLDIVRSLREWCHENKLKKSRSQSHWPWCHLKGHHQLSMYAKYEVSISYGSKVIAKVKVDNRQTNKQTGQI